MLLRATIAIALFVVVSTAVAQEHFTERDDSVRIEHQFLHTGLYESSIGPIDLGETDTNVLLLSGMWSLGDRWTVFASLPYLQRRHEGAYPHNFSEFSQFMPTDRRVVDDSTFRDFRQSLL